MGLGGLALTGLSGIVPRAVAVVPPGPVPISAWGLNNNGLDSFGLNNLSAVGTIQYSAAQVVEGTHSFQSSSQGHLRAGNSASLQITAALTIDFFVRPTTSHSGEPRGLVSKWIGGGGVNHRSYLVAFTSENTVSFFISPTGFFVAGMLVTSPSIPINAWTRITAVYSPGAFMRIYINGILASELTSGIPAAIFGGTAPLLIGQQFDENSLANRFVGLIDDVKIYNQLVFP